MAESLFELLAPHLTSEDTRKSTSSPVVTQYLTRLATLPLAALSTTEPQALHQSSHTNLLALQTLASRCHKSATASATHLSTLNDLLPATISSVTELRDAVPKLDQQAVAFSTTYSKSRDNNPVLDRRKNAMLLSRQVDKVSEILDLPSLLFTAIAAAGSSANSSTNYSQALDLFAYIKRLQILHPNSAIVKSVLREAEEAMRDMTTNLITSLRSQNIRLAAAIRTIGFLRRVAPELGGTFAQAKTAASITLPSLPNTAQEGLFGSLFLTARLANLLAMLEALSPLRDLADQETSRRLAQKEEHPKVQRRTASGVGYISQGQQTERYLKRYIEIFREQSFATVSMFRNIYPIPESSNSVSSEDLLSIPSALATFPLHLVEILMETLKIYLPNVTDVAARESLLMQVLYAAGSLGRLGADFSMMIALLGDDEDEEDGGPIASVLKETNGDSAAEADQIPETSNDKIRQPEWAHVIEKHRVQAARLEALAAGQDQLGIRRASENVVGGEVTLHSVTLLR